MRDRGRGSRRPATADLVVVARPAALTAALPLAVLAAVTLVAVLWPELAPADWGQTDYRRARLTPAWPHVAGTDALGHDVGVRVAEALRVSLAVAVATAVAATVVGVAVGAAAAAGGRRLDALLMRVTDAVAAVPHLLATLVVVALFRGSLTAIVLALAATHWTTLARIVRAETQRVMASEYVAVTRAAGAGRAQVIRHHVLPAVAPQAGIAIVMMVPHAIWHESTLSFLGVSLPPERASLGTLIHESRSGLLDGQWWPLAAPALALVVVTVAIAGLRRAWAGPGARSPRGIRSLWPGRPRGSGRRRESVPAVESGEGVAADGLTVRLPAPGGEAVLAVVDVSLSARPGEVLAVVGESGAGKSTLAAAVSGLLPGDAHVEGRIRAGRVGHVPQNPAAAFTPTRHLRGQLAEVVTAHGGAESVDTLCRTAGLDPALADRYPHQLSGGQVQRAAIAAALACDPAVIVADEPTSALDPDLAHAALRLLRRLADTTGAAVVLVTHDLQALLDTGVADTVAVLRAARVVEQGPADLLRTSGTHHYTAALVAALPAHGLHPLPVDAGGLRPAGAGGPRPAGALDPSGDDDEPAPAPEVTVR